MTKVKVLCRVRTGPTTWRSSRLAGNRLKKEQGCCPFGRKDRQSGTAHRSERPGQFHRKGQRSITPEIKRLDSGRAACRPKGGHARESHRGKERKQSAEGEKAESSTNHERGRKKWNTFGKKKNSGVERQQLRREVVKASALRRRARRIFGMAKKEIKRRRDLRAEGAQKKRAKPVGGKKNHRILRQEAPEPKRGRGLGLWKSTEEKEGKEEDLLLKLRKCKKPRDSVK